MSPKKKPSNGKKRLKKQESNEVSSIPPVPEVPKPNFIVPDQSLEMGTVVLSIQLTSDNVVEMIRCLAETGGDPSVSVDSADIFIPSDIAEQPIIEREYQPPNEWLPKNDDEISEEAKEKIKKHPFYSVVKDFTDRSKYYLLGIDPRTYWRAPEVVHTLRFLNNEKNEIADTLLPGEIPTAMPAYLPPITVQNIYDEPAGGAIADMRISGARSLRPGPMAPSLAGSGRALHHTGGYNDPYNSPYGSEELSPEEIRLKNEGFLFEQRSTRLIVQTVCHLDSPILLVGPTGSGKTRLSNLLHTLYYEQKQKRETKTVPHPYVGVNCATLNEDLAESELFGYVRGAFTGAAQEHHGFFAQASNGTLFLDEFEELSTGIQAKLLTSFDAEQPLRHKYRPKGAEKEAISNFRMIVATNVEFNQLIREERLRDDFYKRLGPCIIQMPQIDRQSPVFLEIFWKKIEARTQAGEYFDIKSDARTKLVEWLTADGDSWPGNVRDLIHCVNILMGLADRKKEPLGVNEIDVLIQMMENYWRIGRKTDGSVQLENGEDKNIELRVDFKRFLNEVLGEEQADQITPKSYFECFILIWTNYLCGSASRAAESYFGKNCCSNPSKKMTDRLKQLKVLGQNQSYKSLIKTMDKNLLCQLKSQKNIDLMTRLFQMRPPDLDPNE